VIIAPNTESMPARPLPRLSTPLVAWIERFPNIGPLLIYALFALAVYMAHGSEPPISIDHISYFKLADEIRAEFPAGDYWRSFNSVRIYGVVLAYLFELTGSHLVSLKVLLAVMTVAYLWSFQVLMGLATTSRPRAVLFSLLSAFFVSFGASIWGVTDFSASLNRTLIIPFVVLLVWFFFRYFDRPWRYLVFPALVLLSLLHLSSLHVFLVFGAFELLDFAVRRRFRPSRDLLYFAAAIVASVLTQLSVEYMSAAGGYVRYTMNMTIPSAAEIKASRPPAPVQAREPPTAPVQAPGVPAPTTEPPAIAAPPAVPEPPKVAPVEAPAAPVEAPKAPEPEKKLKQREAWAIELMAFPWRNFPPSTATLLTIATSFGVIFLIAVGGAVIAFRNARQSLDREMVAFAGGTLLASYGLQILLWVLRDLIPIYPINFEEIRAINMLMIPAVYFAYRLYELAPSIGRWSPQGIRIALLIAFILQPILLIRALPAAWREGIVQAAVRNGIVKSSDAPRMLYARQFLGLSEEGRRFFYSSRPAIQWLERNAQPTDKVLTNLNEAYSSSRLKTVGPFLGIVTMDVWNPERAVWADRLEAIDQVLLSRDTGRVKQMARAVGATYAIVDWPVNDAVYRDDHFSVLRID
jgi:hypothetical protein